MNKVTLPIDKSSIPNVFLMLLLLVFLFVSTKISSEEMTSEALPQSDIQFEQAEDSNTVAEQDTNLTPVEKQIVESIDANHANALKLLKNVVNINSGTMNFEGVKKVGMIFKKEFEQLGFKTSWIDGKSFNRAGHLVARYGIEENGSKKDKITPAIEESLAGVKDANKTTRQEPIKAKEKKEKVKLLLIGHLDTVFTKQSSFQKFKVENGEKEGEGFVVGPGITDMKGGDVVMLEALRALKASGVLDNLQVTVIMTGDEEKRGSPYEVATKELVNAGKWADIALGFEDGDGDPKTAVISRRGATGWQLNVTGRAAHSSQIFREGYGFGAIFEAARILDQFRMKLAAKPNLTFNPGLILGGTDVTSEVAVSKGTAAGKANVIAQTTIVKGDIRALFPHQLVSSENVMRSIVQNNLSETSATLTFFTGYPPMAPSAGNKNLLEIYSQASQDLGFGEVNAVDPKKAGAADISFVANDVEMAIDGLGLMGTGGHTEREKADISTLSSQTKRAALLMLRLSNQ
ncbi:MAG: M20/M25/M40 family metallo-hydrolase [Kangiellaceae bacterium]